jgi:hypothetical protein
VAFSGVLVTCLGAVKRDRYINCLYAPSGEPRALDYFNTTMPGACGYALQPRAAEILVKTYKKTHLAADNAISADLVDIKIHSHLIGEANTNKTSLTKTSSFWQSFSASQGS